MPFSSSTKRRWGSKNEGEGIDPGSWSDRVKVGHVAHACRLFFFCPWPFPQGDCIGGVYSSWFYYQLFVEMAKIDLEEDMFWKYIFFFVFYRPPLKCHLRYMIGDYTSIPARCNWERGMDCRPRSDHGCGRPGQVRRSEIHKAGNRNGKKGREKGEGREKKRWRVSRGEGVMARVKRKDV